MNIALQRFVMSDDLEVDGEGEDELEFIEYRRELKSLINAVGSRVSFSSLLILLRFNEIYCQASSRQ